MRILCQLLTLSCALYLSEANYPAQRPQSLPAKPVMLQPVPVPRPMKTRLPISEPEHPFSSYVPHIVPLSDTRVDETVPSAVAIGVVHVPVVKQTTRISAAATSTAGAGSSVVGAPLSSALSSSASTKTTGTGYGAMLSLVSPPIAEIATATSAVARSPMSPVPPSSSAASAATAIAAGSPAYGTGSSLSAISPSAATAAASASATDTSDLGSMPLLSLSPYLSTSSETVAAAVKSTFGTGVPITAPTSSLSSSASSAAGAAVAGTSGLPVHPTFVPSEPVIGTAMGPAKLQNVQISKPAFGPNIITFQSSGRKISLGSSGDAQTIFQGGPNGPLTRLLPGGSVLPHSHGPMSNSRSGSSRQMDMIITDFDITSPRLTGPSYPRSVGRSQTVRTVYRQSLPLSQGTYYGSAQSSGAVTGASEMPTASTGGYSTLNDFLAFLETRKPMPGPLSPQVIQMIQTDPVIRDMFAELTRLGGQHGFRSALVGRFPGSSFVAPGSTTFVQTRRAPITQGTVQGGVKSITQTGVSASAAAGNIGVSAVSQLVPGTQTAQVPHGALGSEVAASAPGSLSATEMPSSGGYGRQVGMRGTGSVARASASVAPGSGPSLRSTLSSSSAAATSLTGTPDITRRTGTLVTGQVGQKVGRKTVAVPQGTGPGTAGTVLQKIGTSTGERTAATATGSIGGPVSGGRLVAVAKIGGSQTATRSNTGSGATRSFKTMVTQQRWSNLRKWTTARLTQMAAFLSKTRGTLLMRQWNTLKNRIDAVMYGGHGNSRSGLRSVITDALSSNSAGSTGNINAILAKTLSFGLGGAAFDSGFGSGNWGLDAIIMTALAARNNGSGTGAGFDFGSSGGIGGRRFFGTQKSLDLDINDDNNFDSDSSSEDDDTDGDDADDDGYINFGFMGEDQGFGDWDF